ncbi:hypothetical protein P9209_28225 [Prescottella defluvii]|nr:hypothetical protein P9209_28225 [Prescottella defluvii]
MAQSTPHLILDLAGSEGLFSFEHRRFVAEPSSEVQDWFVEHTGESLDPSVTVEVLAVNGDVSEPGWWSGESVDGYSELTDAAIDWIEAWANGEDSGH